MENKNNPIPTMKIILTESQVRRVLDRLIEEQGLNKTTQDIISKFSKKHRQKR